MIPCLYEHRTHLRSRTTLSGPETDSLCVKVRRSVFDHTEQLSLVTWFSVEQGQRNGEAVIILRFNPGSDRNRAWKRLDSLTDMVIQDLAADRFYLDYLHSAITIVGAD